LPGSDSGRRRSQGGLPGARVPSLVGRRPGVLSCVLGYRIPRYLTVIPIGRNIMTSTTTAPLKHPEQFFIDGGWVAPSSSAKIDVINSGTEELYTQVAEAQEADVNR